MKKIFLPLLTSFAYFVALNNSVLADDMSNTSVTSYKQQFEINGIRYDIKIRHSEKGDLLVFNNNTDISFNLFSAIQDKSQLISPRDGKVIECNVGEVIGSAFILSTDSRDFEETLSLMCGDSVVIRERR